MKLHSLLSLLAFAAAPLAVAQESPPSNKTAAKTAKAQTPPQVCADVLMVSLPEERALALLPDLRNPEKIDAAQAKLLELIAQRQAVFVDWPQIITRSGYRAVSENIVEERYPIEFEQPGASPAKVKTDKSNPAAGGADEKSELINKGLAVPTTFETRNTGTTLEFEPTVLDDGQTVMMAVSPQVVRLRGFKGFPMNEKQKSEDAPINQPIFQDLKATTNLTLHNGQRVLLFVGKPLPPDTNVELFILGVKILPAAK